MNEKKLKLCEFDLIYSRHLTACNKYIRCINWLFLTEGTGCTLKIAILQLPNAQFLRIEKVLFPFNEKRIEPHEVLFKVKKKPKCLVRDHKKIARLIDGLLIDTWTLHVYYAARM